MDIPSLNFSAKSLLGLIHTIGSVTVQSRSALAPLPVPVQGYSHLRSSLAPVKIFLEWIVTGARAEGDWTVTVSVSATIGLRVLIFDRSVIGARLKRDRTYSVNQALFSEKYCNFISKLYNTCQYFSMGEPLHFCVEEKDMVLTSYLLTKYFEPSVV